MDMLPVLPRHESHDLAYDVVYRGLRRWLESVTRQDFGAYLCLIVPLPKMHPYHEIAGRQGLQTPLVQYREVIDEGRIIPWGHNYLHPFFITCPPCWGRLDGWV
jgi:hypothetical protein